MARLPTPGSDDDIWGDVLNQYLLAGHNADGTHNVKALLNVPSVDGQVPVTSTSSSTGFVWQAPSGGGGDPAVGGDLSGTASTAQIVANAVGTTEIANNSVTGGKMANATITDTQVSGSAAIAQSKIANLTTDLAAKAADSTVVHLAGTESITGAKTFAVSPVVPAPTNPTDASTKAYVDSTVASGVVASNPAVGGDLSGTASNAQIVANAVGTSEIADLSVTSAKIANTTITDGQISASAAIAQSKIAGLTTDLSGKVSKAGDTMSGGLAIQPALITTPGSTDGQLTEMLYSPNASGATRVKGIVGRIVLGGSSNLTAISSQIGVEGLAENNNTGTVASLVAVKALSSNFGTGTVTELTGIEVSGLTNNGGGTVTSGYGVLIDSPDLTGGAATGLVSGLYVRDQTGATNSYALYTNLGTVRFGDTLNMATNDIINVADPTNAQDAATKAYTDQKARKILPYSNTGALTVQAGTHRIYNDSGQTWTIMSVRASVGTAPVGASVIIDVNKNGTTIFTTQGNRPTVAAAANTSGQVTNMDVTTVANGEYLTVDVDQVGTTTAGSDLTLQVEVL